MSKSLRSIKDNKEKMETINRRIKEKKGGLGYLSALEAKAKGGVAKSVPDLEEV